MVVKYICVAAITDAVFVTGYSFKFLFYGIIMGRA